MGVWNYFTDNFWEVFSLVSGIIYVVLEVKQKNAMWILGMLTSSATVYVFFVQGLYASSVLNVYYFVIAFWGLYQWRKDAGKLSAASDPAGVEEEKATVHLTRLPVKTVWYSLAVLVIGTALLVLVMDMLEDSMSVMDASVAVLSGGWDVLTSSSGFCGWRPICLHLSCAWCRAFIRWQYCMRSIQPWRSTDISTGGVTEDM